MTVKAIDGLKSDDDSWNSIQWKEVNQTVDCLQRRIVKSVRNNYRRVLDCALTMLEPCEVKVSRRVLRGDGIERSLPYPTLAGAAVFRYPVCEPHSSFAQIQRCKSRKQLNSNVIFQTKK